MPTFVGPLKCALQLGGDRTAFPSAGFGHVYGATVHAVVVPLEPISEEEGLSIQGLAFNDDLLLLIGTMQTGYNADRWNSYLLSLIP